MLEYPCVYMLVMKCVKIVPNKRNETNKIQKLKFQCEKKQSLRESSGENILKLANIKKNKEILCKMVIAFSQYNVDVK